MSLSKLNHQHRQPSPLPPPPSSAPELPDLCLLALFSQMTVVDRLSASQVCPQWHRRVRELTKTLTIAIVDKINEEEESLKSIQRRINSNTAGSIFADYLLTADNHQSHHHFSQELPLSQWHRLTPWNTLTLSVEQLNSATVRGQITSAFADLTALTFARPQHCFISRYQFLLTSFRDLLKEAKGWRRKLRHLSFLGGMDGQADEGDQVEKLYACLKEMSALCFLTMENISSPNQLSMLAQLKQITLRGIEALLFTLRRYSKEELEKGPAFKVNIFSCPYPRIPENRMEIDELSPVLRQLNDHLQGGITSLGSFSDYLHFKYQPTNLISFFPGLISLSLYHVSRSDCAQLFPLIAQHLKQLVHLSLDLRFEDSPDLPTPEQVEQQQQFIPPARPPRPLSAQLPSVRLLELCSCLTTQFSADLHWFNLPVTLPNLLAISVSEKWALSEPAATVYRCSRDVLEVLHSITGLPRSHLVSTSSSGHFYQSSISMIPLSAEQLETLAS